MGGRFRERVEQQDEWLSVSTRENQGNEKKTGDGEERSMRDLLVLILGSVGLSLSFLFSLSLPIPFLFAVDHLS